MLGPLSYVDRSQVVMFFLCRHCVHRCEDHSLFHFVSAVYNVIYSVYISISHIALVQQRKRTLFCVFQITGAIAEVFSHGKKEKLFHMKTCSKQKTIPNDGSFMEKMLVTSAYSVYGA